MFKQIRTVVALSAIIGTSSSPMTATAQSSVTSSSARSNKAQVFDVRLNKDNQLVGAVVDSAGNPREKQTVRIQQSARYKTKSTAAEAIETKTDEHGLFRSKLANGGLYQVTTDSGITLVRVWTLRAAPPSATDNILIVDGGNQVARGQRPISELFRINDPVLVATVTAAAIAIPIAIHNSRDDSKSGS